MRFYDQFGKPRFLDDGWIRIPFIYDPDCETPVEKPADWFIAFHGTKPQCLYSIVVNQGLKEIYDRTESRHTIYQHKNGVTLRDVQKDKDWPDKLKKQGVQWSFT